MVRSNPFRTSFTTGNNWPRRQRAWVRRSTCIIRLLQPCTDGESGKIPRMTSIFHLRETPRGRVIPGPDVGSRFSARFPRLQLASRYVTLLRLSISLCLHYVTHMSEQRFARLRDLAHNLTFSIQISTTFTSSPPFPQFIEDFDIDRFRLPSLIFIIDFH